MKVAVIGLGRLGLPLAAALSWRGFKVIGIDVDPDVVDAVNARQVPERIHEPGLQELLDRDEVLFATTELEAAAHADISIVMVPTSIYQDGALSIERVEDVCKRLGVALGERLDYHTVIVSTTVPPGSCARLVELLGKNSGKKVGTELGFCYCPEFVALGNVTEGFLKPDFILVGASDPNAAQSATAVYRGLCTNFPTIRRTNPINAELAKMALNCYLATKMTFANTLAALCEKLPGADANEVLAILALDSRVNARYLKGATAYGGTCIPRDTYALARAAEAIGVDLATIWAVARENEWHFGRLLDLVEDCWETSGGKVGVLGLAFKPGSNVTEESVGMMLLDHLDPLEDVIAYDPLVRTEQSVGSAQECVDETSVVIVTTACEEFKGLEFREGQTVIDCWRIYYKEELEAQGVDYVAIGLGP